MIPTAVDQPDRRPEAAPRQPGQPRPTDQWLAVSALEPLAGPGGVAERLLLLIHYGIDWTSGWLVGYRAKYWDLLRDRAHVATWRTNSLRSWWSTLTTDLQSGPRNTAERTEVGVLLQADPVPVLETLRTEIDALVLRTRIVTEAVRVDRHPAPLDGDA